MLNTYWEAQRSGFLESFLLTLRRGSETCFCELGSIVYDSHCFSGCCALIHFRLKDPYGSLPTQAVLYFLGKRVCYSRNKVEVQCHTPFKCTQPLETDHS